MDTNYSNYDMFDKLISNNKKAQSWTIFWVVALCIMAGVVLWMAFDISKKKKIITEKDLVIQTQEEYLVAKNHLIDSLVANCNVAKKEIINTYDSVITKTEDVIKAIENTNASVNPAVIVNIPETQQAKLDEAKTSIRKIKENMNPAVNVIGRPRIFIQYNNKENYKLVEELSAALKSKEAYFVTPAEFIDNSFPTMIRFYNYNKNDREENDLKKMIAGVFKLDVDNIQSSYETNPKVKATIEILIGTRNRSAKYQFLRKVN